MGRMLYIPAILLPLCLQKEIRGSNGLSAEINEKRKVMSNGDTLVMFGLVM